MSTWSQLRFVQRIEQTSEIEGDADRVAQVYRHSDGYPASVLQDFVRLKELLDATLADRGPGYTAAAFVFLDKYPTVSLYLDGDSERTIDAAQPADLLEPSNMEHLDQPLFLLGHGVEDPSDGIHSDEEYLYFVELPTRNPFDEPTEWRVKVSEHSGHPQ